MDGGSWLALYPSVVFEHAFVARGSCFAVSVMLCAGKKGNNVIFSGPVASGHIHHPDAETLREYDRQCYETLVEHWADKILAQPTRAEQQAQVEATPTKIKQAARLRALDKIQEQRQG